MTVMNNEIAQRRVDSHGTKAKRLESLERLVGGVVHDLNNLLTVVGSHSDFLRDEGMDSPDARRSVEEIQRAVQAAAFLTRQLLVTTRPPPAGTAQADPK